MPEGGEILNDWKSGPQLPIEVLSISGNEDLVPSAAIDQTAPLHQNDHHHHQNGQRYADHHMLIITTVAKSSSTVAAEKLPPSTTLLHHHGTMQSTIERVSLQFFLYKVALVIAMDRHKVHCFS